MKYELFNFLAWTSIIGFFLFLIIGTVLLFQKKRKSSLKLFGFMMGCLISFIALFQFAYPEELLTGAQQTTIETEVEGEASKQVELYVNIVNLQFDEKKKTISTEITANLPDNTEILMHLRSEKPNASDKGVALLLDYEAEVIDEKIILDKVPIYQFSGVPQKDTNYFLTLDIPISEESNEDWLEGRYEDDYSNLKVNDKEYGRYANLEVADTITIANGYSPDEVVKMTDEKIRLEEEQNQQEIQARKDTAKEIRFAELNKNPEKHAETYVKYQGEILQIMEDESSSIIRLAVTKESYGYNFNDVVYITYAGTTEFVDEDIVTVYGTIMGSYTYESQAGYNISLPHIKAEIIE